MNQQNDTSDIRIMVNEISMFMCEKYMSNKDTPCNYDVPAHEQATKDLGLVCRFPGVYIREIKDIEPVFDACVGHLHIPGYRGWETNETGVFSQCRGCAYQT